MQIYPMYSIFCPLLASLRNARTCISYVESALFFTFSGHPPFGVSPFLDEKDMSVIYYRKTGVIRNLRFFSPNSLFLKWRFHSALLFNPILPGPVLHIITTK